MDCGNQYGPRPHQTAVEHGWIGGASTDPSARERVSRSVDRIYLSKATPEHVGEIAEKLQLTLRLGRKPRGQPMIGQSLRDEVVDGWRWCPAGQGRICA